MINGIEETQHFLNKIKKDNKKIPKFVLSNLRMSICELG
jgi:hypothetical protein